MRQVPYVDLHNQLHQREDDGKREDGKDKQGNDGAEDAAPET